MQRCNNERVMPVHSIEQLDDGRPYFVMDYADRGTLRDRIDARVSEGQGFDVEDALHLAEELAECLIAVHKCGVVHGDLKPSNVLFKSARGDGRERMLVADLGLAQRLKPASGDAVAASTADYAAPEQADPRRSANVDARTDVYAAGVILYQLLSGRLPFNYTDLSQAAARTTDAPELDALRPEVPAPLAQAVRAAMSLNPLGRYATGRAWREALRRVAVSMGVPPGPPRPMLAHEAVPTQTGDPLQTPIWGGATVTGRLRFATEAAAPLMSPGASLENETTESSAGGSTETTGSNDTERTGSVGSTESTGSAAHTDTTAHTESASSTESANSTESASSTEPAEPRAQPVTPQDGAPGPEGPPSPPAPGDPAELADLTDFTGLTGLTGLGGWPGASNPPWLDDEHEGRSNRWWLAVLATIAVAAVVVALVIVVRHQQGAERSSTAPTTAIPTGSPAVTGWFAAASKPGCAAATPDEQPPGASAAVICTAGAISAAYCRMGSPGAASAYLASLHNTHPDAVLRAWTARPGITGQALVFTSDHGPALAWTYTGKPYLGIAEGGTPGGLESWWQTGRTVRPGGR